MSALWVDAFGGLSGDIWVAGLQALGVPEAELKAILARLPFPTLDVRFSTAMRCGLQAHQAEVCIRGQVDRGEHPHLHQPGTSFKATRRGKPFHGHTWAAVDALLAERLEGPTRDKAREAYRLLGESEARVHGIALEAAHFHEVGNQDSIADVVLAAAAWTLLGEPDVHVGPVAVGYGTGVMAHGQYPIPTPATLNLLSGFEVVRGHAPEHKELTTPTGAALAAALATHRTAPARFIPHKAVFACGSYDFPHAPAASRFVLGRVPTPAQALLQIETNVDDATPQQVAFAQARLLEAGALDVWVLPATFKKGRAGWLLGCIVPPALREPVIARLVAELPTLGVRCWPLERVEAERRFLPAEIAGQSVSIKEGTWPDTTTRQPEYDDAARAAQTLDAPLRDVQRAALNP